jgi:hypothetical protein
VPARPGPLVRLADAQPGRDEVDEALDDVFGAPDDGGAGPLDIGLLFGGAGAVIVGLTSLVPGWVLVAGIVAFCLGAVLPLRSLWRRGVAARRRTRLQALIGDGTLLRTDHPSVVALVAAHDRCVAAATGVVPWRRVQIEAVAHAAVAEVATLLAGRAPAVPGEVRYIEARSDALSGLADALADPVAGDDEDRRQAVLDARAEVELADNAVRNADALTRALRDRA